MTRTFQRLCGHSNKKPDKDCTWCDKLERNLSYKKGYIRIKSKIMTKMTEEEYKNKKKNLPEYAKKILVI